MNRRHLLRLVGLAPALVALPALAQKPLERKPVLSIRHSWDVLPQDLRRTGDQSPVSEHFRGVIQCIANDRYTNWDVPLEIEFYTGHIEAWLSSGQDPLTVDLRAIATLGNRSTIIHRAMDLRTHHHCRDLVGRDHLPLKVVLANHEALWPTWQARAQYGQTLREQIRKVSVTCQLTG